MKKAIVLSSGGADSTTCLSIAIQDVGVENVTTIGFSYGQKHTRELEASQKVADYYNVNHMVIDLTHIFAFSNCALLNHSTEEIEDTSYANQISKTSDGKVSTYVPFRNGLMLSTAAAIAMSIYPDDDVDIYIGAHADDAAGDAYADCRPDFIENMKSAIDIGTYHHVHVIAPLNLMTKAEVIKAGLDLNTPYHLTTSCYHGRDKACGKCGTCIDRLAAFAANGAKDPIEYE